MGLLAATAWAQAPDGPPDIIFLHGKIHTQNAQREVVEALGVRGQRIVAVGTDQSVGALAGPKTRIVDLKGEVMLPGFIDAHTHPADSAQMLGKCSLDDKAVPFERIKAQIDACLAKNPGDAKRWYEVVMVNPTGNQLTALQLDKILKNRPLMLEGADGHTVWLNSAALAAAHLDKSTPEPKAGRMERNAAGNPSGVLRDDATLLASAAMPPPTPEEETALLRKAFDQMHAVGITSVQDAAADDHLMSLYKRLYDAKQLDMRVRGSFRILDLHAPAANVVKDAKEFRSKWSVDPDFLRADAIKIFADGVIEFPSQTAALLEPYLDAAGRPTANRGPSYFTTEGLNQIVTAVDAAGFTVHIHAIGDRAVRSALDAFEAARRQNGSLDNRDQIAHLELIEPPDFPRFKALHVIANFQLLWALHETYVDEGTLPYLGPERSKYLYPARSLKDAGALIAGGSDWGVSSFDPFIAMEHGITRAERRGAPRLLPEQALSLQDMVDAYTLNAAYALKQEKTTGSLEAGKFADLVVLDRDLFRLDAYDLHSTRVLFTYVNGREVFRANQ
jgi:predicted amidohydrolase YtcJ